MVLDILDTLTHAVRYDEFIVLSVDADFTPVLLRLREHDRRTAMVLSGPAAAALKAACDFVIPDSLFMGEALGLDDEQEGPAGLPVAPAVVDPDGSPPVGEQMEAVVRQLVEAARVPVAMAKAAHEVRRVVGQAVDDSGWAGCGSFGEFVATLEGEGLKVDKSQSGWIYDPARHAIPAQSDFAKLPVGLPEVARRVNKIVGVPLLPADHYATLFEVLAADAQVTGGNGQAAVERTARDACAAQGHPVSRAAVHFVLLGLGYSRFDWAVQDLRGADVAIAFAENVLRLAAAAQMDLTPEEESEIKIWIAAAADEPGGG